MGECCDLMAGIVKFSWRVREEYVYAFNVCMSILYVDRLYNEQNMVKLRPIAE